MKKIIIFLPILLLGVIPIGTKAQIKKKKNTVLKTSQQLTPFELEIAKHRKENQEFYKKHIEGIASSTSNTGVDYSNFKGKNCSEIAKKENWSQWSPPIDADKKCEKYLKLKKVKKVLLYPLNK